MTIPIQASRAADILRWSGVALLMAGFGYILYFRQPLPLPFVAEWNAQGFSYRDQWNCVFLLAMTMFGVAILINCRIERRATGKVTWKGAWSADVPQTRLLTWAAYLVVVLAMLHHASY